MLSCPFRIVLCVWLVLNALLASELASVAQQLPYIGINRTNLAWEPVGRRKSIIEEFDKSGARLIRLSWREPRENMRDVLDLAARRNIVVLIEIPMVNLLAASGSMPRPASGSFGARTRLSDIEVDKFAAYFDRALTDIEQTGVKVVAFQLGNEINWADFNGDLPLMRPGRLWQRIEDIPPEYRIPFEKGLDTYAQITRIARRLRNQRPSLVNVPIVSAGLADISEPWVSSTNATGVSQAAVIEELRKRGALDHVDGFGMHLYTPFETNADLRTRLDQRLAVCGTFQVGGHPCWITEFGGQVAAETCDIDDARRRAQIAETADFLSRTRNRVAGMFYYDWDQQKEWGLVRCGTLSAAGKALIEWSRRMSQP